MGLEVILCVFFAAFSRFFGTTQGSTSGQHQHKQEAASTTRGVDECTTSGFTRSRINPNPHNERCAARCVRSMHLH